MEFGNLGNLILAHKSFIILLRKRGPKVEPCGIPDNMGKVEENFPKMRTTKKPNN
jgi:hypothetical protein